MTMDREAVIGALEPIFRAWRERVSNGDVGIVDRPAWASTVANRAADSVIALLDRAAPTPQAPDAGLRKALEALREEFARIIDPPAVDWTQTWRQAAGFYADDRGPQRWDAIRRDEDNERQAIYRQRVSAFQRADTIIRRARETLSAVPTVDVGSPDVLRFRGLADGIEAHASSVVQFPFLGRLTDDERIELGLSLKCAVLAYCEGCFGVDFGPDEPTPTPTDGADPLELDRLEEVARAAMAWSHREVSDNRAPAGRFHNTFDPPTALRLIAMARGKS